MTQPPDYTSMHRVVALQCATQLSHLGIFSDAHDVLMLSETLLCYLNDGIVPPK